MELKEDLLWWKYVINIFNGVCLLHCDDTQYEIFVNSSSPGAAMQCCIEWYYINWHADLPFMIYSRLS